MYRGTDRDPTVRALGTSLPPLASWAWRLVVWRPKLACSCSEVMAVAAEWELRGKTSFWYRTRTTCRAEIEAQLPLYILNYGLAARCPFPTANQPTLPTLSVCPALSPERLEHQSLQSVVDVGPDRTACCWQLASANPDLGERTPIRTTCTDVADAVPHLCPFST